MANINSSEVKNGRNVCLWVSILCLIFNLSIWGVDLILDGDSGLFEFLSFPLWLSAMIPVFSYLIEAKPHSKVTTAALVISIIFIIFFLFASVQIVQIL